MAGPYLGDFIEDATVNFIWDSNGADGASITRATNGTVAVWKDNGTSQSTAGVTDAEDFDGFTGVHACTIDTSADAFYATGSNYTVMVTGATIDGKTVNAVLAHFSIENRTNTLLATAAAVSAIPTTAMRGTDSAALASVCTEGRLAELDAGNLPTDVAAIPTTAMRGTDSAALASVCTEGRLAELDAGNLPASVDAVKAETALIVADTGTTLDTKLNDMQGAGFVTGTDSLEAIRNRGDVAWTTGAGGSDRLLLQDTTIATLASQTSFTLTAGSADNDAYKGCTIVVEDVAAATQKAVGVISGYVGATKTVTLLNDPGVFAMAATDKVYILAEKALKPTVDNKTFDGPTKAEMDTAHALLATAAAVSAIPTTAMRGTDSAALASVCTEGRLAELDAGNLPTDVAAIPTTAMRGTDSAATASDLATVDGNVDAILNRIGNFAGTGLNTIKGWLQAIFRKDAGVSAANIPSEINEIENGTTGNYDPATDSQEAIRDRGDAAWVTGGGTGLTSLATGTAQAGTATTITLAAGDTAPNDTYNQQRILTTGGTGVGQSRTITDYVNSTKVAAVNRPWTTNPDATTTYEIQAAEGGMQPIRSGTAQGGAFGSITLDASASVENSFYKGFCQITGGLGVGQSAPIVGYNGTTKVLDISPAWSTPPDVTSTFAIWPRGSDPASVLTESYAALAAAPTLEQAIFAIQQGVLDFKVVGTVLTLRKQDGTDAMTFTLDNATAPTDRVRAT